MATEQEQPPVAPTSTDDLKSRLEKLKASATQQYSLKNYSAAAEFYSEAAEVQDEINGEMSLDNADLLYQYGRCLYHVAVSNSDVLGGKVAGTSEEPKRKKRKVAQAESSASAAANGEESTGLISDAIKDGEQEVEATERNIGTSASKESSVASKPFFQITGDENWTDSESEDDDPAADAAAEEEEDDFATAYEILDMARVLLSRKVEAAQQSNKGKSSDDTPEIRQLRERLADTHDLQAEISLENERFTDAINDTRDALALKLTLYPQDSSLLAEAHFKLSLALEFASVTSTTDETTGEPKSTQIDQALRSEAATEMSHAIASCRARVERESLALSELPPADSTKISEAKRSIADVKEMIADMEQRLVDLRDPAAATNLSGLQTSGGLAGVGDGGDDALRGVLGAMLAGGSSKSEQAKILAEATEKANDLSGLVKHRKKNKLEEVKEEKEEKKGGEEKGTGKGKKRMAEDDDGEGTGFEQPRGGGGANANGKRVKFEG